MKFGLRTPSAKKSFKAMTTGKLKRAARKAIDPTYGKKGVGILKNPKKVLYNKTYNKTTVSAKKIISGGKKTRSNTKKDDFQIGEIHQTGRKKITDIIPKKYTDISPDAVKNRFIFIQSDFSLLRGVGYFFIMAAIFAGDENNFLIPWIVKGIYLVIGIAILYFTSNTVSHQNNKSLSYLNRADYKSAQEILDKLLIEHRQNLKTYEILFYFYLDQIKDFEKVDFYCNQAINLGTKDKFIKGYIQ